MGNHPFVIEWVISRFAFGKHTARSSSSCLPHRVQVYLVPEPDLGF